MHRLAIGFLMFYGSFLLHGSITPDFEIFRSSESIYQTVATSRNGYLVVWRQGNINSNTDVWGVRIDKTGGILDASPILIASNRAGNEDSPAVAASNGTDFVVAWWQNVPGAIGVYASRIDRNGRVLDT